jgi:glycosyltransferase involved in cell wall biosynthesis
LVELLGADEYRYVYTEREDKERSKLGWGNEGEDWCLHGDENAAVLSEADVLMSGERAPNLFEKRAKEGKTTLYCSERWFKPPIGFLRVFVPSYFKMARRIVKLLNESDNFYYLPMGIHAARDMARLCGLMNGDWKCLFRAPKLDFERKPGGRVFSVGVMECGSVGVRREGVGSVRVRECVGKMRMWGYFVDSSEFRVGSLELGDGLVTSGQSLVDSGKGADSSKFRVGSLELGDGIVHRGQELVSDSSEFRVGSLELNHGIHRIHGKKGCGSEGVKVLWVGRLLKLKRVDSIIKAVGECSKSKTITLDVYGLGPEEAKLKKLATKYGDVIKFHPPVLITEVRKLMREHDVYVLSSNGYEGWGAVVSEALEEGMAVIGTYEAGSSATILPERSLFHAGDWRKLKELLERDVEKVGIGHWTAKSAAEVLLTQRWG